MAGGSGPAEPDARARAGRGRRARQRPHAAAAAQVRLRLLGMSHLTCHTWSNAAGSVWRRTIMLYGKGRNDERSEATALGEGWLEGGIGQGLPWTDGCGRGGR